MDTPRIINMFRELAPTSNPEESCTTNGYSKRYLYYATYSSVWGGTAGATVSQAFLASGRWQMAVCCAPLLLNWTFFPFALRRASDDLETSIGKRFVRLGYQESAKVISFATAFFICLLMISNDFGAISLQGKLGIFFGLASLNLISCYGLRQLERSSDRINLASTAKKVAQNGFQYGKRCLATFSNGSMTPSDIDDEQESLSLELKNQIAELKIRNNLTREHIKTLTDYLVSQPLLMQAFQTSVKETADILLPPFAHHRSQAVDTPIVEVWRLEMHEASRLAGMKTRIRDFLIKNPNFCDAFQKVHTKDFFLSLPQSQVKEMRESNEKDE